MSNRTTAPRRALTLRTPLRDFFHEWYQPAKLAGASRGNLAAWRQSLAYFETSLGRPAKVAHLNRYNLETANGRLARLGYAAETRRGVKRRMRTLWGYAAELQLRDPPGVMRRSVFQPAEAWRPDLAGQAEPLQAFLDRVYFVDRALERDSQRKLLQTVRLFSQWAGREANLADLNTETLNRFIAAVSTIRTARHAKNQRGNLICIWRVAHDAGDVAEAPSRIRKVRVPQKIPTAWTRQELAAIISASERLPGMLRGIPRGAFMAALIRTGYDTGLRRGDLYRLHRGQLSGDAFVLRQHKTGCEHVCRIRPATAAAIEATFPPTRDLVFPRINDTSATACWREIMQAAAVPRERWGGLQQLRRTSATHVEQQNPGLAGAHLGHLTPGLAYRSYVDPRIARAERPLPPDPFAG